MFFQYQDFPDSLIKHILHHLPPQAAIRFLQTAKRIRNLEGDTLWQNYGAKNLKDFIDRIQKLPTKFQQLVLSNDYNLPQIEELIVIFAAIRAELISYYDVAKQLKAHPLFQQLPNTYLNLLCSKNGICALAEGLISPAQVALFPTLTYLSAVIKNEYGLTALREGLITIREIAALPSSDHVWSFLITQRRLNILREGLISLKQAALLSAKVLFSVLTNDEYLLALRRKVFSIEEIAPLSEDKVQEYIEDKIKTYQIQNNCFTVTCVI